MCGTSGRFAGDGLIFAIVALRSPLVFDDHNIFFDDTNLIAKTCLAKLAVGTGATIATAAVFPAFQPITLGHTGFHIDAGCASINIVDFTGLLAQGAIFCLESIVFAPKPFGTDTDPVCIDASAFLHGLAKSIATGLAQVACTTGAATSVGAALFASAGSFTEGAGAIFANIAWGA
jgi:hypothetical protein